MEFTSSFTQNAFSNQCSKKTLINTVSENEVCAPNPSYLILTCDTGNEFTLDNGIFPYASIFHIDSLADGVSGTKSVDDVDMDTMVGGFASAIVGDCADPTAEERVNFLDALNIRTSLGGQSCEQCKEL